MREVDASQSWTHALAIRRMQTLYNQLQQHLDASPSDADATFICTSEFLYWTCVADEAFKVILGDMTTSDGRTYAKLRLEAVDGQHLLGARWARNKVTHCVVRPVRLENTQAAAPGMYWRDVESIQRGGIDVEKTTQWVEQYRAHFANRPLLDPLKRCYVWISEVRYDYRDPDWAKAWFAWRP